MDGGGLERETSQSLQQGGIIVGKRLGVGNEGFFQFLGILFLESLHGGIGGFEKGASSFVFPAVVISSSSISGSSTITIRIGIRRCSIGIGGASSNPSFELVQGQQQKEALKDAHSPHGSFGDSIRIIG